MNFQVLACLSSYIVSHSSPLYNAGPRLGSMRYLLPSSLQVEPKPVMGASGQNSGMILPSSSTWKRMLRKVRPSRGVVPSTRPCCPRSGRSLQTSCGTLPKTTSPEQITLRILPQLLAAIPSASPAAAKLCNRPVFPQGGIFGS